MAYLIVLSFTGALHLCSTGVSLMIERLDTAHTPAVLLLTIELRHCLSIDGSAFAWCAFGARLPGHAYVPRLFTKGWYQFTNPPPPSWGCLCSDWEWAEGGDIAGLRVAFPWDRVGRTREAARAR